MIEITTEQDVMSVRGTLNGGKSVIYVYLVDGMLVDSGPESLLPQLTPFLMSHSFDLVAFTHNHEDHTGAGAWLEENKHLPMYIHPMSVESCAKPGDYPVYRQKIWGCREGFHVLPIGDTIESRRYRWEVIETPGHSDDHLCFLNKETGILFSGDLFVTPKPKIIMRHESIPTIMNSIRRLLTCDFESMFCCHAGFIPNGKEMMRMKLDYLETLAGSVLKLHNQGLSIAEINHHLFPVPISLTKTSNHEWDPEHIVHSIVTELN
jgi:glyoxylase-like metal-dependent hydrolase (beta-lactamase superfamily II)